MASIRIALLLLVVLLAALVPAEALSLLPRDEGPQPVGMNAVDNVLSFAMAHPARFQEQGTMLEAREDLAARLAAMGYEVERHAYIGGNPGVNILGILRGTERPHDWMVLSAHYDIAVTPFDGTGASAFGAWDDGSGVAALLEIARVAAQQPWENTLAIAFFDDEEAGLVGSGRFVSAYDGKSWEGGTIRLVANVNMDPPGLNWPCPGMPVTTMQDRAPAGPGGRHLRNLTFEARALQGVPEGAYEHFEGGVTLAFVLRGTSDNANFARRGVPEMYIGSTTHLKLGGASADTTFPLHTPADNLASMVAWCGGDLATLSESFAVEMRMALHVLRGVDAYAGGAYPRP